MKGQVNAVSEPADNKVLFLDIIVAKLSQDMRIMVGIVACNPAAEPCVPAILVAKGFYVPAPRQTLCETRHIQFFLPPLHFQLEHRPLARFTL